MKWQKENKKLASIRSKAPAVKRHLRSKGCDLPFYDLMDSYEDEFRRIVADAKRRFSSIVDVHEVDEQTYRACDWPALGYSGLQQVIFNSEDAAPRYGEQESEANVCGYTSAFFDQGGKLRTGVMVRNTVKDFEHKELKYAFKIPALLHELGHVQDIEQRLFFNVDTKTVKIIDAEVHANLYALDKLAERHLVHSYGLLFNAFKDASKREDYLGEVSRKVLERMPQHKLIDWNDYL
ncbi:MAG: hypothetical protein U0791_26830 [Gemmataceae bacterium]